jgi:two-component system, NtrC family, response regulator HydG
MEPTRISVLVVDDEPALREVLSLRIQDWGHNVRTAVDATDAERALQQERPDVVLSDVVLPEISGVDLLRRLKQHDERLPVIMMTAHGNIDAAVEAMKAGARDFLTKPLDYRALRGLLDAVAAEREQRELDHELDANLQGSASLGGLVGRSRSIREMHDLIQLVAATDASVIITGESGTGKEVVAHAIHTLSNRRDKPFIALNAAAIPEGLIESELFGHEQGAFTGATRARPGSFELANGGTLFLDEIAEMPVALQPKLLRILEGNHARRLGGSREIEFDVRVLAATNRSVTAAVRDGLLREDLYYRLNVFEIALPPLRERADDVVLLSRHFVREFSEKHDMPVEGVSDTARALLEAYAWPGNVRELRNVIERAVIMARTGWIEPRHLSPHIQMIKAGAPATIQLAAGMTLAEAERLLILNTLERTGQNKAEAARQLGLDVKTIRNRLRGYGLLK